MRSLAARLVLLILALAFTSCSKQQQPATSAPVAPTELATSAPPTPIPSPTPDARPAIITLTLWLPEELDPYSGEATRGYILRQLAEFSNTYPDLSVEIVVKKVHGRGGMLDFLRTAPDVAPSLMPDLMVIDADDLEQTTAAGLIRPLDDLLSPSVANDRFPFATSMGQYR